MNRNTFFVNIYLLTLTGALLYLVIEGSSSIDFKEISADTALQVTRESLLGLPTIAVILISMILASENGLTSYGSVYPLFQPALAIFGILILYAYIEAYHDANDDHISETLQVLGIVTGAACIFYFVMELYHRTSHRLMSTSTTKRRR